MQTKNNTRFKKGMTPWNKGTGEMSKPKICKYCSKEFYSRVPTRKFCSHRCAESFPVSKETREKKRQYMLSHPQKFWLGKKNPYTVGKNNVHWNGGKTSREGYTYTLSRNHPHHNNENYVKDHRLVAEKALGRYLFPEEVIHHINGITDDNRIENLYLFPSNSEHAKHHGYSNPPILTSNLVVKERY